MRISEEYFYVLKNKSMRVYPKDYTEFDKLVLDLRDTKEAVKILQDRLRDAEEKNKALRLLSDSQAEALNLMEMGRL